MKATGQRIDWSPATDLVKADALELAAEVDALRTDAEDSVLLETTLRVDGADRHGRGQRRWNGDRHNVKDSDDHRSRRLLQHTHTGHQFNGIFSTTIWVNRRQKG